MNIKRIDGILFGKMLQNGLANLKTIEEKLNMLNVFPVADGDTGTNMCLTLENGLRTAKPNKELGTFLRSVSEGMLYGARGNSGVILSQLFNGFATELARCYSAATGEFKNGFYRAYKVAYSSVVRPVEGTILTVAREGIENIRHQIRRDTSIEQFFSMYIAEMQKSLSYTPQLLPELKEANVVDSGAMGYIAIIEGMLKYLYGENIKYTPTTVKENSDPDFSLFDENSNFLEGYCMEFILQRLNNNAYDSSFRMASYLKDLEVLGNSIVAIENGSRVKIHIHTRVPGRIIELSQRYGEFISFKLENMQLQHNEKLEMDKKLQPKSVLSIISVVNGEGMKEIFSGIGCDIILEGGASSNPSAQDFAEAYSSANADYIVVLPNDKNIIAAAKQAAELRKMENVIILPTRNMVEGYFTLAMDVPDSKDAQFRIRQMKSGAESIHTVSLALAARDSSYHGIQCKTGDCLAFLDGELAAVDSQLSSALVSALLTESIEEKSAFVLFRGKEVAETEEEKLSEILSEKFPDIELSFLYGGQIIYPWLIGIL